MTTLPAGELPEAVAFRARSEIARGLFVWSRWLSMSDFNHISDDGESVQGPSPYWSEVEYAYSKDALLAFRNAGQDELRRAVADYMYSEGCDCCRGDDHEDHAAVIAKLLGVPMYSDGQLVLVAFGPFRTAALQAGKVARMTRPDMPGLPEDVAAWPSLIPTRYPYTYAFDLLRSQRPLPGDNGRGDMSQHVTKLCQESGADMLKVCRSLANAYIAYEQALEAAADARESAITAALTYAATKDTP